MPRTAHRRRVHRGGWRQASQLLAATAIAAGLAATASAPAGAQVVDVPDAVGDLVGFSGDGLEPAPDRALGDISRTRVTHAGRVRIRIDFISLRKVGHQELDVEVVTDEGARRSLELSASRGHWRGRTWMWASGGKSSRLVCKVAVRHSIDYDADVVRISFPRRCVSTPRWVKLRMGFIVDGHDDALADDAFRDRALVEEDRRFAWSDRVRVG